MPKYQPKPVDTRGVALDPSLVDLAEYLARNTHEVWAQTRQQDGWSWGPRRDDDNHRHPGLVPYEQLTYTEQQLDRNTAIETLKLIAALGYGIVPPEPVAGVSPNEAREEIARAQLPRLIELWQALADRRRHAPPELYSALAERALVLGESLLGYDAVKAGLRLHPSDARLRQLQALSLARGGACDAARSILEQLRDEGRIDEETLGLLARSYKDLWERSPEPTAARSWLVKACDTYEQAWALHRGFWSVINVATLAACLGESERSTTYAALARDLSLRELDAASADADQYWPLATLGEASLLLGDSAEAERYYGLASARAGCRYGNIGSTRRNARLLLRHLGHGADAEQRVNRWLRLPRVVVFAGHMIDEPDRVPPRFPASLEPVVAAKIRQCLADLDAGFGYASAACGADLLFLEAMLERGGEVNVVLPYEAERFIPRSVSGGGGQWEARFWRVLRAKGVRVILASQGAVQGDSVMNAYANLFNFGMAGIRAWQLGTQLAALAVWDGHSGDGPGGTADAVCQWRTRGCEPVLINPAAFLSAEAGPVAGEPPAAVSTPSAEPGGDMRGLMVAMLFADVVGYSKFTEDEIPLFIRYFLKPASELAAVSGRQPLQMNTWGDGLYFVFANVADAGRLALDLRDLVSRTDWAAIGFRNPLGLRTALHVGPVHVYMNPATGRADYIGTHVSRAARIEPVTPAGQVYASEAFAAIAFAEQVDAFRCEYVGQIGLAKEYGTFPTYHVRRSGLQDVGM